MARLFRFRQETALQKTFATAVKVRLKDVGRDQQSGRNHQPKCGNRQRPKMEEWNHRWRSFSPSAVYTSSILAPAPVERRPQHDPNPEANPLCGRKMARKDRQDFHEDECQRD